MPLILGTNPADHLWFVAKEDFGRVGPRLGLLSENSRPAIRNNKKYLLCIRLQMNNQRKNKKPCVLKRVTVQITFQYHHGKLCT